MATPKAKAEVPAIPDRILTAAARVMQREGFAAASLRQIAEEAGLTKAGLYYHVASKEALLFALHERFADKLVDKSESIRTSSCCAADKLRELMRETICTAGRFQSEGTVFMREYSHLTGEMQAVIGRQRDHYRNTFEEVIQAGMDAGEFRPGNARLDALMVLGACNFSAFWYDPNGPLTIEQIADAFVDRLLHGLCTGAAQGAQP